MHLSRHIILSAKRFLFVFKKKKERSKLTGEKDEKKSLILAYQNRTPLPVQVRYLCLFLTSDSAWK